MYIINNTNQTNLFIRQLIQIKSNQNKLQTLEVKVNIQLMFRPLYQ